MITRASRYLLPTLKDDPADAEAVSHRLLVRAGYVRQVGSGLYSFLPLGWKVMQRIAAILREEMDTLAMEVSMPVLNPAELWKQTGRYDVDNLFRLEDSSGKQYVLAMTHRYIFLLAETASQMFESRQSRTVGVMDGALQRRMTARTAGVLLSKSVELSGEVYLAMQSRGFRGDVNLLTDFRMRAWDYIGLATFLIIAGFSGWMGRA